MRLLLVHHRHAIAILHERRFANFGLNAPQGSGTPENQETAENSAEKTEQVEAGVKEMENPEAARAKGAELTDKAQQWLDNAAKALNDDFARVEANAQRLVGNMRNGAKRVDTIMTKIVDTTIKNYKAAFGLDVKFDKAKKSFSVSFAAPNAPKAPQPPPNTPASQEKSGAKGPQKSAGREYNSNNVQPSPVPGNMRIGDRSYRPGQPKRAPSGVPQGNIPRRPRTTPVPPRGETPRTSNVPRRAPPNTPRARGGVPPNGPAEKTAETTREDLRSIVRILSVVGDRSLTASERVELNGLLSKAYTSEDMRRIQNALPPRSSVQLRLEGTALRFTQ